MRPALDIVLFDVDDTLYSTTAFARVARRKAIDAMIEHGLQIGPEEGLQELTEVVAEFSSNYEHHFDRLLDRLGPAARGDVNRAVLIAAAVAAYHETKAQDMHVQADAKVLLDRLHDARVRMGVLSAGLHVKQAEKLIRLGVLGYFDPTAIFFSDQMGVSKPNPKIFQKAVQALGVDPTRVLYIGDRVTHDIIPARAVGLKAVLYRGAEGKYLDDVEEGVADHVVDDLRSLIPILADRYGLAVQAAR